MRRIARLGRAVLPAIGGGGGPLAIKLWITPPAYTNRSPIFVEVPQPKAASPARRTLEVPAGSHALLVVTGAIYFQRTEHTFADII